MIQRRQFFALAFLALCVGLTLTACAGFSVGGYPPARPNAAISAEAMKGAQLYVEYSCVQCHGIGGRELVPTSAPSLTSAEFKKAFPKGKESDQALAAIIRNGMIIEDGRAASMPAWNGILTDEQVESIVAYIRAGLPDVGMTIPPTETGEQIYQAFSCVKCHGQLGMGGIRNAAATTAEHRIIPSLGGREFKNRFDSSEKVRAVVQYGKLLEGGRPGVVYMPGWGRIGTADQIQKVVDYIWE